jgi:hypothetical protein
MDPNASVPVYTPVEPAADGLERQSPAQQPLAPQPAVAPRPVADQPQLQPGYDWRGQWWRPGSSPWGAWPAPGAYPQAAPRPLQPPFSLRPPYFPGFISIGLTAIVMVIGILGSTGPDLDTLGWIAILAGLNIGFVWIVTLIVSAQDTRLRFDRRTWARWACQPVIFFVAIAIMTSGVPASLRFEASRSALEQAAARAQAGNLSEPGLVGLIQVYRTTTDGGMTLFQISPSDMSADCAIVYAGSDTTSLDKWFDNAWGVKPYGHGWWYGCEGYSSD